MFSPKCTLLTLMQFAKRRRLGEVKAAYHWPASSLLSESGLDYNSKSSPKPPTFPVHFSVVKIPNWWRILAHIERLPNKGILNIFSKALSVHQESKPSLNKSWSFKTMVCHIFCSFRISISLTQRQMQLQRRKSHLICVTIISFISHKSS